MANLMDHQIVKDELDSPRTESEDANETDSQETSIAEDESNSGMHAPETHWYHGELDRYQSEERLWEAALLGSYLVRQSATKPGYYVLSYLGRTGINHFRITPLNGGDFYIGTNQFDSLNDLVGYYTSSNDILKGERLLYPVAPPEPVDDQSFS